MMQKVFNAIEKVNLYLAIFLGFVLILMTLTVTREVFGRYVLDRPTSWVLTFNQMMMVAITYLGSSVACRQNCAAEKSRGGTARFVELNPSPMPLSP